MKKVCCVEGSAVVVRKKEETEGALGGGYKCSLLQGKDGTV